MEALILITLNLFFFYVLTILIIFFNFNDIELLTNLTYNFSFIITIRNYSKLRDSKGRFRSPTKEEYPTLIEPSDNVKNALVGNMLGDGNIRYTHKDEQGKPKPSTNANFSMTLKNKEYIYHLKHTIYQSVSTNTLPHP